MMILSKPNTYNNQRVNVSKIKLNINKIGLNIYRLNINKMRLKTYKIKGTLQMG